MGDLTFGRPFDMLKTGKDHECIKLLKDGKTTLTAAPGRD